MFIPAHCELVAGGELVKAAGTIAAVGPGCWDAKRGQRPVEGRGGGMLGRFVRPDPTAAHRVDLHP